MISNTMRNVVPYQHELIGKLVKPNSVDLCIASLQALSFDLTSDRKKSLRKFSQLVQKILKQIFTATKAGGVCCIVVGNDYDFEKDALVPIMTAVLKALEPSKGSGWIHKDEIIWVKSSKDGAKKMNDLKNVEMVSFDQIPFSHILVLVKDPVFEFKERSERVSSLRLSERKKEEMEDSIWYVQPSSEKGYSDVLPKEIVARLIMMYSKKGSFVLDPFAGDGLTGVIAKSLGRSFLCLVPEQRVEAVNERISKVAKNKFKN